MSLLISRVCSAASVYSFHQPSLTSVSNFPPSSPATETTAVNSDNRSVSSRSCKIQLEAVNRAVRMPCHEGECTVQTQPSGTSLLMLLPSARLPYQTRPQISATPQWGSIIVDTAKSRSPRGNLKCHCPKVCCKRYQQVLRLSQET
jgi:hypothetical protein